MAETKYGKYFITRARSQLFLAAGEKELEENENVLVANLDDSLIKGAPLLEASWLMPAGFDKQVPVQPHSHDFVEILASFGSDPNNPHDLGAETEIWLAGEKHVINKSHILYIPKGLEHGPMKFTRMDRPVFHFGVGLGKRYR
jgi:hypothetical protein